MLKLNHLTGFGSGAAAAAGDVTSYVFDGASYLQIPDHADWNFSTGNFTIEGWFRCDGWSTDDVILYDQYVDTNNRIQLIAANAGGGNTNLQMRITDGGSTTNEYSGNVARVDNVWVHLAVVRDGNTMRFWGDGVDIGTSDCTGNDYTNLAADIKIGDTDDDAGGADAFSGYIDEYRISDTARYTTGFTPTTTQFTSDANTLLLIHGGEAYTGALTGETTQSCVTFDGTTDYLSVPDHADWEFGAGEFTVDFWINTTQTGTADRFMGRWGADGKRTFCLQFGSDNKLHCYYSDDGAYSATFQIEENDANTINDGAWHHVAVTGNTTDNLVKMFIDGTVQTDTEAMTTIFANDLSWLIGDAGLGESINANLSEIRILKGAAAWTTSFTPSTTRYTSDANTVLLIHGDENSGGTAAFTDSGNTGHTVTPTGNAFLGNGGTFTDSGNTGHTVSENGQAQKETEQEFKLADDGVGYFFDGTGDYLSIPDHADWNLTGDHTIECFIRLPDVSAHDDMIYAQVLDGNNRRHLSITSDGTINYYCKESSTFLFQVYTGAGEISDNTWYHVAVVRDGDDYYTYVDGVSKSVSGSPDSSNPSGIAAPLRIGTYAAATEWLGGYIDELRVSDTCRYPDGTTFAPTTTQFVSDANTLLLIHGGEAKSGTTGSGATFTDSGDTGHTVTENGNAIESTGNFYKF